MLNEKTTRIFGYQRDHDMTEATEAIDGDTALMIFSLFGGVQALAAVLIQTLGSSKSMWFKTNAKFTNLVIAGVWWPVFISWIIYLIADSAAVRELVLIAFSISMAGPFLLQWVGLFDMMMTTDWVDVMFWIQFAMTFVFTGVGMWLQLFFQDTIY